MKTLLIGGARSGKSRHAMARALEAAARGAARPLYVATSRAWDADHQARIARHRAERGPEWESVEEEVTLSALPLTGRVVVVDCLTLWLTNIFLDAGSKLEPALEVAKAELDRLAAIDATLLLVTNEIGQGVHAETEIGRKFVDLQGFVNQHAARLCDEVLLMVAGIPLTVKAPPR